MENLDYWKKCSSCKKPIGFGKPYQVCSVSTCNSKKTGLKFCSIECWDAHLGFANHRESFAEEMRAPTQEEALRESTEMENKPTRRIIPQSTPRVPGKPGQYSGDALIVVSKVKSYIKQQSQLNTSQCAIDTLTQIVARECDKAIESAIEAGRKTVMGRDLED